MSFKVTIDGSVKDLSEYAKEFIDKVDLYMDKLADFGVDKAIENVGSYSMPFSTGELVSSIHKEDGTEPHSKLVVADGGHADYVEYGTGVIGENSPHPSPERAWAYDVNNHGQKGWMYPKGGKLHRTKGMPSRPFMYRTSVDMEENALKIADEVFK